MLLNLVFTCLIFVSLINCQHPDRRLVSSGRYRLRFQSSDEKPWAWSDSKRPRRPARPHRTRFFNRPSLSLKSGEQKCGEAPLVPLGGRIVGGRKAELGEYPWQVAMLQKGLTGFEYQCGGAIIKEQWIITAAHCVEDVKKPEDLKIAVGTHNIKQIEKKNEFLVDKIVRHEKYRTGKGGELINDIALLHLSSSIDLKSSGLVNSVCLPEQDQKFIRNLEVSGWGRTHEFGLESDVLRTVEVFVKSNAECRTNLQGLFREREMLCAGVNAGGKDACRGDSGGPIIKRNPNTKRATLVGLVSYGIGCARKGKPGVYTRVASYVNWINKNIE